jgi:hypothetical protein
MSTCGSCGARIRWATTVNGRRMPVDDDPVPDGNLVLSDPAPGAYAPAVSQYVEPDQPTLFGDHDAPRFVSHFATCPDANKHRREDTPA